jgi:hypothetical protein
VLESVHVIAEVSLSHVIGPAERVWPYGRVGQPGDEIGVSVAPRLGRVALRQVDFVAAAHVALSRQRPGEVADFTSGTAFAVVARAYAAHDVPRWRQEQLRGIAAAMSAIFLIFIVFIWRVPSVVTGDRRLGSWGQQSVRCRVQRS